MNLPNSLTLTRIFLVPLLVVVLLTKVEGRLILGFPPGRLGAAIFGLASLTDWLDGYLARRRKQVTTLGQLMDPIADKLLTSAAFISLVQMDAAPAWMVAVIIGREFAVTALRSIAYARGLIIPSSPLGKVKMASQVVRHPAADPGARPEPGLLRARADRPVGGGGDGGRVGGRLLPQVQPRPGDPGRQRGALGRPRSEPGPSGLRADGYFFLTGGAGGFAVLPLLRSSIARRASRR